MCKFTSCKLRPTSIEYDVVEMVCIDCGSKVYASLNDMVDESPSLTMKSISQTMVVNRVVLDSGSSRYGCT